MMMGMLALLLTTASAADGVSATSRKVIVVGLNDNVRSNYFNHALLAEDTGIAEDSICYVYNKVIEQNLRRLGGGISFECWTANQLNGQLWRPLISSMAVQGEGPNVTSDLSHIDKSMLKAAMQQEGARYLLVIDAHYLDYREKPMPMLYHYVNYSCYDSDERKVATGQSYFPAYEPQGEKEMTRSSMKLTRKIVDRIAGLMK